VTGEWTKLQNEEFHNLHLFWSSQEGWDGHMWEIC